LILCTEKAFPKRASSIDLGVQAGVIDKSGSWYSYGSQRIGQGREATRAFLKENPEMFAEIEKAVRDNTGVVAEAMIAGPEAMVEDAA